MVHLKLPVSFFMVKTVVAQGQWKSVKIAVHTAVLIVQPLSIKICLIKEISGTPVKFFEDKYPIKIMGKTISFAGNPKINANRINPSRPIALPSGSSKLATKLKSVIPFILIFAVKKIIIEAGIEDVIALPKTKIVRSKTLLTITLPICGFLNGGNSRIKGFGFPFKNVLDNSDVASSVTATLKTMNKVKIIADKKPFKVPFPITKKAVIIAVIMGKRPLQGTKQLVIIASNRSLFESIILLPVTPTALQPKPMHIVRACLPQLLHFINGLSK